MSEELKQNNTEVKEEEKACDDKVELTLEELDNVAGGKFLRIR